MKYTKEQLKRFVVELRESNLSKWEVGFVATVNTYLTKGHQLSKRQIEILERLHGEKAPL
jgi:hypothetical protein